MRVSALGLLVACLGGCELVAPVPPSDTAPPCSTVATMELSDWVGYMDRVDALGEADLLEEYRIVFDRYLAQTEPQDGLRLAYVLSRPGLTVRNVEQSRDLLTNIAADSVLAPYRDLLVRDLDQRMDLEDARQDERDLRSQLEALKGIDADLTRGQEEMDDAQDTGALELENLTP